MITIAEAERIRELFTRATKANFTYGVVTGEYNPTGDETGTEDDEAARELEDLELESQALSRLFFRELAFLTEK